MKLFVGVALLAFLVAGAGAQDFVNGSFETGDFTGWNVQDAADGSFILVDTFSDFGFDPVDGNDLALFAAVSGEPDTISQTISTVAGQQYTLSFYAGEDGFDSSGQNLQVTWNGISYFNSAIPSITDPNTGLFTMTHYTMTVWGTGSDTAAFGGFDGPAFLGLDGVSLTPVSTPEPASMAFLGLGAVGILLRRRRK